MVVKSMQSLGSSVSKSQRLADLGWYPSCQVTYNRDSWVKLIDVPSEYSHDQALLLCQESSDSWIAWVPNHGEVVLEKGNFYC